MSLACIISLIVRDAPDNDAFMDSDFEDYSTPSTPSRRDVDVDDRELQVLTFVQGPLELTMAALQLLDGGVVMDPSMDCPQMIPLVSCLALLNPVYSLLMKPLRSAGLVQGIAGQSPTSYCADSSAEARTITCGIGGPSGSSEVVD